MISYKNGNALVSLYKNGTRVIEYNKELKLDNPLNLDIRVSTECSLANLCTFCHEDAQLKGKDCDYEKLKEKLSSLPIGIELAIGCNNINLNFAKFLKWCKEKQFICNITINQGHVIKYKYTLTYLIKSNLIKGLGISYRDKIKWNISEELLNYENTVFHVIAGIDDINDIINLKSIGVKKILVLGEKSFGRNLGKVDLNSKSHKQWYWYIGKLFETFDIVSFDNLALEQLNIKRFLNKYNWNTFYNGEHSFYINAADGYYSPSSRSNEKINWNLMSPNQYFKYKNINNLN